MSQEDRTAAGDEPGAVSASEQQTSEQPPVSGAAAHDRAEARAAEIREEVAVTDARRAEEEAAKQHEAAEKAQREEERAHEREREARSRAERLHGQSEAARTQAQRAAERGPEPVTSTTAADALSDDGAGGGLDAMLEGQRPEVLAGAAFAGAFIFARILKRLLD